MTKFRPLLAATYTEGAALPLPLIGSPKIDGFRCLTPNMPLGIPDTSTRALKLIKNTHARALTRKYTGLDGEIVCGDPLDPLTWDRTKSQISTQGGEPDFTLHAFDLTDLPPDVPFVERNRELRLRAQYLPPHIKVLEHYWLRTLADVNDYEEACVRAGWEGIMLRVPHGRYKYGRSTLNEFILTKWKRMERRVARIIDFVEASANQNEAKENALGYTSRSTSKLGRKPKGTLGALICEDPFFPERFKIGTGEGLDDVLKQQIWNNRGEYLNKKLFYDYQVAGSKDRPRIPSFKGFT